MRPASVSVDLDPLSCYRKIHGLAVRENGAEDLVYRVAVPRFLELFAEVGIPATLFVVGSGAGEGDSLRQAHLAGHELGNHTGTHPYNLTRLSELEQLREVREGEVAIARITGSAPVGFRAPGYTISASLMRLLAGRGYRYDASVFPAVPYYLAKAAVMAGLRLVGRPSKSVLDRPRVLRAPLTPYHPAKDEPYASGDSPLVELPMAIVPGARIPFLGTLVAHLPERALRWLYGTMRRLDHFSFELHGVDLLDTQDLEAMGESELAGVQRDLRTPVKVKRARLRAVFQWLREDYDLVTLEQAAKRF